MKINVTKGSAPLNLIKYLRDPAKQRAGTEIEIDTNLFGRTEEEQAEEFRFSHNLNPRVKQTMHHFAVSLAPGERVDSEVREQITTQVLQLTGHEDCQYLSVEHFDHVQENDVQHWHIATSNVDLDGKHIEDDFLYVRLREIEQRLEQDFNLVKAQNLDQLHIPTGEYHFKQRTREELPREKLWNKIHDYTQDHPSMVTFAARLKADGVNVKFWDRKQTNEISGISYEIEGWKYQGGKLNKSCSFPGLQKHRGVTHDSTQDQQLRQIEQMSAEQCQEWLRIQREQANQKGETVQSQSDTKSSIELDPLQTVRDEQSEYAQRLAPQVKEIWEREQSGMPLATVVYERYQIRLGEEDEPELYRENRQILGYSNGKPQGYGLTEQDCAAIDQFNQLSQQQAFERLRQIQIQIEQLQEQENDLAGKHSEKRSDSRDRSLEDVNLQSSEFIHVDQAEDLSPKVPEQLSTAQTLDSEQEFRDLYQRYCPSIASLDAQQRDIIVAGRALQNNHSFEETVQIVAQGSTAQTIEQEKGKQAGIEYARSITKFVTQERERSQVIEHER